MKSLTEYLEKKFGKPEVLKDGDSIVYLWNLGNEDEPIKIYLTPHEKRVYISFEKDLMPAYQLTFIKSVPTKEAYLTFKEIGSLAEKYGLKFGGEIERETLPLFPFVEAFLGEAATLKGHFLREIYLEDELEKSLYQIDLALNKLYKFRETLKEKLIKWATEITIRDEFRDLRDFDLIERRAEKIKEIIKKYKNNPQKVWYDEELEADLRRLFFEPTTEPYLRKILGNEEFENIKSRLKKEYVIDWHAKYTDYLFPFDDPKQIDASARVLGGRNEIKYAIKRFKEEGKIPELEGYFLSGKRLDEIVSESKFERALKMEFGEAVLNELREKLKKYKPEPKRRERMWWFIVVFLIPLLSFFLSLKKGGYGIYSQELIHPLFYLISLFFLIYLFFKLLR